MEWLILAMMIGGTVMTAYGQYQAAQTQKKWADYNATVSRYESQIREEKMKKQKLQILSSQRAAYAGAGVQLKGTPLEVMDQTARDIERDISLARYGSEIEAERYRIKGKEARRAGMWKAGTSLLTGGAETGYMGYNLGKFGKG